jgi:NAD(P)-dependent dehydrogenase (short-subunit alcohol dehydrogenase family)
MEPGLTMDDPTRVKHLEPPAFRNRRSTPSSRLAVPGRAATSDAMFGFVVRQLEALSAWPPLRPVRSAVLRDLLLPETSAARSGELTRGAALPLATDATSEHHLAERIGKKTVLVTGGSSGIGLETAKRVAAAGALTLICGRDAVKLARAERQLGAHGGRVVSHTVDLADLTAVDALVERLLGEHGGVDVLVNNAGRSIRRSVQHSLGRFHDVQRTMQLNFFGALRLTTGLLPAMLQRGQGHVINVSSLAVQMGPAQFSAYSASKAAFDAWTRCAASELESQGIEFTTLYMPLVRTAMIAPTASYDRVPALSAEQAAELLVRAIVRRPTRIATTIGVLAEIVHATSPSWMRRLGNVLFQRW